MNSDDGEDLPEEPAREAMELGWPDPDSDDAGGPEAKPSHRSGEDADAPRRRRARRPARTRGTYDLLLGSAREHFAKSGYEGATVRNIALAAGANIAAIAYHFGSKRNLYLRVLGTLLLPLGRQMASALGRGSNPLDSIGSAVESFFFHIRRYPEMPAIMVRELLSGQPLAAPVSMMIRDTLPLFARTIAEGQQDGTIRPGDPMLLTLSTIAQPVYFNIARKALHQAANLDLDDHDTFVRVVQHCVETVRAQLAVRPS
jgi:AcrR family transcriptional regulator